MICQMSTTPLVGIPELFLFHAPARLVFNPSRRAGYRARKRRCRVRKLVGSIPLRGVSPFLKDVSIGKN
jgi:hypothetical protein